MEGGELLQGLLWFVAFLFSTTVHEAMHALAALRGGDPTAYLGGQVSFSPGLLAGVFVSPEHATFHHLIDAASASPLVTSLGELLTVLLVLNVLLFVFNMLPFPPLDGASAIGGVLPERTALAVRAFAANPVFSLVGIFIAWQVFPYLADPLFRVLLWVVHPGEIYS